MGIVIELTDNGIKQITANVSSAKEQIKATRLLEKLSPAIEKLHQATLAAR